MAEAGTLEHTPTWVVAAVCTVIVAISLAVERLLHYLGKFLKHKGQTALFSALQKIKEGLNYLLALVTSYIIKSKIMNQFVLDLI